MLKNFLKDSIDSKNPATRISAIEKLEASVLEDQEKLKNVILNDADDDVRTAAIRKIADVTALVKVMLNSRTADTVKSVAKTRFIELLSDPVKADAEQLKGLMVEYPGQLEVMIACHCSSDSIRDDVIKGITEQKDLATITVDSRFHTSRAAAAASLSDESLMESSAAAIKTRDKVVARELTERLDASRAAAKLVSDHQNDINHLITSMKSLAGSVWSPQYAGRFTNLSERWVKLDPSPEDAQSQAYDSAYQICKSKVEEFRNQQQAQQYCQQSTQQLADSEQELALIPLADYSVSVVGIRQKLVDIDTAWQLSASSANPDKVIVNAFQSQREMLNKRLKEGDALSVVLAKVSKDEKTPPSELRSLIDAIGVVIGDDPGGEDKTPVIDQYQFRTDAYALRRKLISLLKQRQNEDEAKIKSIQKQLGGLAAAISGGKWAPANSLYSRIEKKVSRLDDSGDKKTLADKLQKQKTKLDELADWHDFASKPKLEALCEKMESLPAEKLSPTDQASRIKELQDEWKSIGASRCANELWPRFKTAGDTAFEPVAEFYSKKREERDSRLTNKKQICERLSLFVEQQDWESADWKSVEKILRVAKNEWRENRIVDRKPDAALEQSFTVLVQKFNEHLNAQYDANAAAKEELIEKIAKLAEGDISQHAVNQTKRLQNSWKQTGIMRRRQDQELWEKFNGHCREIYKQHKNTERQKAESGLEHVVKARELVKSIKALCKASDPDEKSFNQMQEEFNALPEFPEKDKKFLFRDFNQASEQFNRLRDQSTTRAAKAELIELQRRSALCDRYEKLVSNPQSVDEQALDELSREWDDSAVALSKKWLSMINKRKSCALEHIKAGTQYDYAEGDKIRRLACIQAEILAGKDTPTEDKAIRMTYQLEQLQQGISGNALSDTPEQRQAMLVEWMSLPPALLEDRDRLESRFKSAIDA